jgi:hypothetical protein
MNKFKNLSIFIVAFSVLMIGASAASTLGSISPVFASTDSSNSDSSNSDSSNSDSSNSDSSNSDSSSSDSSSSDSSSSSPSSSSPSSSSQTSNEQPSLETVSTHLKSCIQQIENDNTDEALNDCKNADDQLDGLLANATG